VGYTQKVVIVGAGISGLACAFRLKQLGIRSIVLEAADRPGGVIATLRRNGFLFELGPQCPRFPASVWRLVREIGLEPEFIAGDPKAKRYIVKNGQLQLAPFSPAGLLVTGLLGLSSKLRILTEVLSNSQPPRHEESLAEFVQRKFGSETLENLVDPLISTVFFGDAYKMGMQSAFPALVDWERKHGSLVRGALRARALRRATEETDSRPASVPSNQAAGSLKVTDALPSLGSFRDGMGRLPEKLADVLGEQIRYGVAVESARQTNDAAGEAQECWEISTAQGESIIVNQLVLCVPAYEAARIIRSSAPAIASQLRSIEYAPMHGVAAAYDRQQVRHPLDGFGFMVPRKEGLRTICTFWNSSLFPQRAPEGKVLLTSFVRSDANENSGSAKQETLARAVETENARILAIPGAPEDREVWSHPQALPQFNVGHARTVAALNEPAALPANLYLAGNYLKGRSIGDCVDLAFQVAQSIHSRLHHNSIQPVGSSSSE